MRRSKAQERLHEPRFTAPLGNRACPPDNKHKVALAMQERRAGSRGSIEGVIAATIGPIPGKWQSIIGESNYRTGRGERRTHTHTQHHAQQHAQTDMRTKRGARYRNGAAILSFSAYSGLHIWHEAPNQECHNEDGKTMRINLHCGNGKE